MLLLPLLVAAKVILEGCLAEPLRGDYPVAADRFEKRGNVACRHGIVGFGPPVLSCITERDSDGRNPRAPASFSAAADSRQSSSPKLALTVNLNDLGCQAEHGGDD